MKLAKCYTIEYNCSTCYLRDFPFVDTSNPRRKNNWWRNSMDLCNKAHPPYRARPSRRTF